MGIHPAILSETPTKDDAMVSRLIQQMRQIEEALVKIGSVELLLKRIKNLEDTLYTNKEILSLEEASQFLGASKSQLYKLTRTMSIPHYKPGGKAIYFYKSEIIEWVRQHPATKGNVLSVDSSQQINNAKQQFSANTSIHG